ncbi:MAG: phosphogluconate dehydrogenase (NAD(+)-dependent, decarboxylating) [Chloroflexota bacterium]|nr:decarboxylating 6-phosphogluconate dehydrogenase [Chloroflexota bacterium]
MELGMIGLGRMGGNMARRLLNDGHRVIVFDPVPETVQALVKQGAVGTSSIAELTSRLSAPRTVWLMVPSGEVTESTVAEVAANLSAGDCLIDGGNSYYKDSMRRATVLSEKNIYFLDVGTSGGIWGLKEGYCLTVGGEVAAFRRLEPIFQTLAPSPDRGYGHVGPSGAGHFVKMVHNGIEYGLMEAYAEGFELMQAKQEFDLDLEKIAEIWRYGSVVRSWLLDLVAAALHAAPKLEGIQAYVEDSGEGRWTVQESIELGVPAPVIAQSLQNRFRSRQEQPFGTKLLAALRQQFGGHAVKKARK